ncbi:hypothetical protein [uncultured Lacinutrix sp.]|uniref:hypothetical protein n=1 Tax=uncultured Lacinutrix sp. TaxID=574032 RepID=UPI00261B2960|nr:hypothetical protein [uncultured Lacinutrix sp.]
MKIIKKILASYFLIHIVLMMILGFSSFSYFKDDVTFNKLNPYGQAVVKKADEYRSPELIVDFIFLYSIYTGTNRGFSFFSPNVSASKVGITFMSNGKEIELPLKTQELALKFRCLNSHFNSNIFNIEEREIILKSISSYIFSNNTNLNQLDVYLDINKYPSLLISQEIGYQFYNKQILAFSITKNNDSNQNSVTSID